MGPLNITIPKTAVSPFPPPETTRMIGANRIALTRKGVDRKKPFDIITPRNTRVEELSLNSSTAAQRKRATIIPPYWQSSAKWQDCATTGGRGPAQKLPSSTRVAAGEFGFLILIQVLDGPDR